jgi:hypothetical protein
LTTRALAFVVVLAAALAGCGGGRDALDVHRARWAAERRGLEDRLDRLEERLLTDQARVRFWQEMRERHESVTAIACTNLERHVDHIAALDDRQREKRATLARRSRVASATFEPPGGGPR